MSQNNSVISRVVLNVSEAFLKQETRINEKLDDILAKKLEKLNSDQDKYSEVLKFNILFYKTLIRNTEPLIGKWIEQKSIPNIDSLEEELEIIADKCREYINKIREEGVENLKESDLNSFNFYDKMQPEDKIKRLEKDYRVLNVYKDLLNITLRKISLDRNENLSLLSKDPRDIKRELKRELIFSVNKMLSSSEEFVGGNVYYKENNDSIKKSRNDLEELFLRRIKESNYDVIFEAIENKYRKLCLIEGMLYREGYGFGKNSIAEFASSAILLGLLRGKDKDIVEGAMRLVIIGEFGEKNFQDYMSYVIENKLNISTEVWNESIDIIKTKYQQLKNHDIALKKCVESNDVDIAKYVSIIESVDKNKSFNNPARKNNIEKNDEKIQEEIEDKKENIKDSKKENKTEDIQSYLAITEEDQTGENQANESQPREEQIEENKANENKVIEDKIDENQAKDIKESIEEKQVYEEIHEDTDEDIDDEEYTEDEEDIDDEDIEEEYLKVLKKKSTKRRKKKKKKILAITSVLIAVVLAFGAVYAVITNKEKKNQLEAKKQQETSQQQKDKKEDKKEEKKEEISPEEKERIEREAMIKSKTEEMESYKDGKGKYYIVYAASHKLRENSEETLEEYRAKGVDGTIVEANGHFRIKINEYDDYASAKSESNELAKKSISTYILQGNRYYDCKIDLFELKSKDMPKEDLEKEYYNLKEELGSQSNGKEYVEKLDRIYEGISQVN